MKRTELKRYQRHTLKRNQPLPDFPGGPVAKNLPCNAGDAGSTPGQASKMPQLRLYADK